MNDESLIRTFYDLYTNKQETMYRLPMNTDIEDFWPAELQYRKDRSLVLPLCSFDGNAYWYSRTERFLESADTITAMARSASDTSLFAELQADSLIDEAYFSSAIEGAFSTKDKARLLIESGRTPADKNERMIFNNYKALRFALEQLDEPISEQTVVKIAGILTDGTEEESPVTGYRDAPVYVVSRTGETVYTAPSAHCVPGMMDALFAYINDPSVHPVEKAVIAHAYFVTVHPFFDGNGRTARALTYMILLQSGYDFFRYVPISGILAENRPRYYKALRSCQDTANGGDFTYFTDFYTSLLADTLQTLQKRLAAMRKYEALKETLGSADHRLLKGACWMATGGIPTITAAKWQNKFGVSFETARTDLMELTRLGFLSRRTEGRKLFFDLL